MAMARRWQRRSRSAVLRLSTLRAGFPDVRMELLANRASLCRVDDSTMNRRRKRRAAPPFIRRSEEHTSELQSLMRISYAVFCLKKQTKRLTSLIDIRNITQQPYSDDPTYKKSKT